MAPGENPQLSSWIEVLMGKSTDDHLFKIPRRDGFYLKMIPEGTSLEAYRRQLLQIAEQYGLNPADLSNIYFCHLENHRKAHERGKFGQFYVLKGSKMITVTLAPDFSEVPEGQIATNLSTAGTAEIGLLQMDYFYEGTTWRASERVQEILVHPSPTIIPPPKPVAPEPPTEEYILARLLSFNPEHREIVIADNPRYMEVWRKHQPNQTGE